MLPAFSWAQQPAEEPDAESLLKDGKPQEARLLYEKMKLNAQAAGDAALESDADSGIGKSWYAQREYQKAVNSFDQALSLRAGLLAKQKDSQEHELRQVAQSLDDLGRAQYQVGGAARALDYYTRELVVAEQLKDVALQARTLYHIGAQQRQLSRLSDALASNERALPLFEQLKNTRGQAVELDEIGAIYDLLSEFDQAVLFHQRALFLMRELHDPRNEGHTLIGLAGSYLAMGRPSEAVPLLNEALDLESKAKDAQLESSAYDGLGQAYNRTGEYEKAIDAHTHALALDHELKSDDMVARTKGDLALVYYKLNQYQKAIDLSLEALQVCDAQREADCQTSLWSNLSEYYEDLKESPAAFDAGRKALWLGLIAGDRQAQAIALTNLGQVEEDMGRPLIAHGSYARAVELVRAIKDRPDEEDALYRLGALEAAQGEIEQGRHLLEQAMLIQRAVDDPQREARTLRKIADLYAGTPELSVFFGKEAVNRLQSIRAGSKGLAAGLRKSYLEGSAPVYRKLAATLLELGRLAEAQQVLDLLKQDEIFEFARRDPAEEPVEKRQAELTPEETAWNGRYQEISGHLVDLANEREQLASKAALSAAEKARLAQLDKDYEVGNQGFEKFLTVLTAEQAAARRAGTAEVSAVDLRDTSAMQDTLQDLGHGAVAIYTLVGEETFRSILVTPKVQKGYTYKIPAAELNRKVFALRQALLDPAMDPRPLAEDMYRIVLGPMAADLAQVHAETLMISLDGALRYVPVAALYDGSKYVIERYKTVMFTPASATHLKDAPAMKWDAAGFGVSKSLDGAPALPGVARELEGIIRTQAEQKGVLPGEIRLDGDFTEDSLRAMMRTGPHVAVHIASHFRLSPGNDASSFLLLGDGEHLSLADIGVRLKGLFRGVDLLTLSACETGVGLTGRDGHEVEGFGVIAQRNGAKSVVASLWSVSDNSTSVLMQDFYRSLAAHANTKLDALRDAQLSLLHGQQGDFSHPFYWAPFFMMGNWL